MTFGAWEAVFVTVVGAGLLAIAKSVFEAGRVIRAAFRVWGGT